ncbi:MAG: lytic transglycosylase domain-containing protein [Desulfobacterales bacterium]
MKSEETIELIVQTLLTGIIRPLLLVTIIWGMAAIPSHDPPVKVMRFKISQPANLAVQTDQSPPYVSGRKAERQYHKFIVQTASKYQIDPALIKAIIMAESGYNPKAVSKKGAKGLMQLMPETAEALGVEDIFNPRQNITGGVQYFKRLVNRFNGDVKLALAAYNAGSRYVRNYNGVPPFKATRYYIKKVLKYYQKYKNQPSEKIDKA